MGEVLKFQHCLAAMSPTDEPTATSFAREQRRGQTGGLSNYFRSKSKGKKTENHTQ